MNLNILAIETTMHCMTSSKVEYHAWLLIAFHSRAHGSNTTMSPFAGGGWFIGASSVSVTLHAQVCRMYCRDEGSFIYLVYLDMHLFIKC